MTNAYRLLSALFVLAALLIVGCGSAGPAEAVEDFYYHVEAGEVDEAVELFSDQLTAVISKEKLKTGLAEQTREMKEKGGIASFEVLSEEITGQVADVRIRVEYGNGETEEQDIRLTEIEGQWKLSPEMDK